MKNKKPQVKSMLSMLALMLAVSAILALPGTESNNSDSILQQPSVGEGAPDRDEDKEPREQPLASDTGKPDAGIRGMGHGGTASAPDGGKHRVSD